MQLTHGPLGPLKIPAVLFVVLKSSSPLVIYLQFITNYTFHLYNILLWTLQYLYFGAWSTTPPTPHQQMAMSLLGTLEDLKGQLCQCIRHGLQHSAIHNTLTKTTRIGSFQSCPSPLLTIYYPG